MSMQILMEKAQARLKSLQSRHDEVTAQITAAVKSGATAWASVLKEQEKRVVVLLRRQENVCKELSRMQLDVEDVAGKPVQPAKK